MFSSKLFFKIRCPFFKKLITINAHNSDSYFKICVLVAQLCLTLCDSMDCNLPGSSVHRILQSRILEWVAILFSRVLPNPRMKPRSPELQVDSLPAGPPGKY